MKKLLFSLVLFSFFFSFVSAETISQNDVEASTYIIGNYMFTRNKNPNYDGVLTTKRIMIAAKTIDGNSENKMIIYYKRINGEWIDALSGETIVPPTSFDVERVDMIRSYITMSPSIEAGNLESENGYLSLSHSNAEIVDEAWSNTIEYNNSTNPGISRFTIKVDEDFIDNEDTYYDVTIDYYDAGTGIILMQSSNTEDNSINYRKYGYGSYVEEGYFWSDRQFNIKNLTLGLTNTREWKSHTFNVTSDFFEHNQDNYIHLYFGRKTQIGGEPTDIKIKKITITKRLFKIDATDKNDRDVVGNIYTDADFGMSFTIKNTSDTSKEIDITYEIVDINDNVILNKSFNDVLIDANKNSKYIVDNINKYGEFKLNVKINYNDESEEETFAFSKIIADLTNNTNDFLGLTTHLNYGGWYSEEILNSSLDITKKLGVNSIRQGMNNAHIQRDITDYNNTFGRYEETYDELSTKNINLLSVLWNPYNEISDANFDNLKEEITNYYSNLATKYGSIITYYEMPGEWNNISLISPEKYAELVVTVSKAIKGIDSNAKIVALSSMDDIWSETHDLSYYSATEYGHQTINHNSWMAKVFKTKWLDGNNELCFLSYVDAVSLDFYPYNYSESISSNHYYERISGVREMIDYYNQSGRNIPIIFTETGYNTSYYGADHESQAKNEVETLIFGLANKGSSEITTSYGSFTPYNFEKIYVYSLQDEAKYYQDGESNFGIVNNYKSDPLKPFTRDVGMSAKASYIALNAFNYLLKDARLVDTNERVSVKDYQFYKFEVEGNKNIIAIWSDVGSRTVSLTFSDLVGKNVTIYDMYGNVVDNYNNLGITMDITINDEPIYISYN